MNRRDTVLALLALGTVGAPLASIAQVQGKVWRVGFISAAASSSEMVGPEPVAPTLRAFLRGLQALGYVEGKNLIVERRMAEARFERVGGIVAELIRANVDVIVAVGRGTAAAAKQATTAAPIVVVTSSDDPVAEGLVQSLARPGGNVTGFTTSVGPEIEAKRLELLRETLPAASRIALDNRAAMPNERIAAIRAPTLIFHATDDTLQLYRNAEFAAATISGSRLRRFDSGGHLLIAVEQSSIRAEAQEFILANAGK